MSYVSIGGVYTGTDIRSNGVLIGQLDTDTYSPVCRFHDSFLLWVYETKKATPDLRLAVVYYEGLPQSVELHTECERTIAEAVSRFGAAEYPATPLDIAHLKYHYRHVFEELPRLGDMML